MKNIVTGVGRRVPASGLVPYFVGKGSQVAEQQKSCRGSVGLRQRFQRSNLGMSWAPL
jgi:hypothetical protein